MDNFYQTIIIGAGPGGLVAGKYLKDALILDKKRTLGSPVQCGEGISQKALDMQDIDPDPSWISCNIHRMARYSPKGYSMGGYSSNPKGYIIDREKFEKFLSRFCQARIRLDTKVISLDKKGKNWEIKTETGEIFLGKYVIASDGPHSLVRRKFFPNTQRKLSFFCGIGYLVEFDQEIDTKTAEFHLDNEFYKNGYGWFFPKSKTSANIGIGGDRVKWNMFEEFLADKIKSRFGDFKILKNRSGVVPSGGFQGEICKDGLMLVGDAAGLADPIFDGGMTQAMQSAKIATKCILEDRVESYEEEIKNRPFSNPRILEAKKAFYSLDNESLNELGKLLDNKSSSYLKTFSGLIKVFSNKTLRKNKRNLYNFFSVWVRVKDYLW